MSDTKVIMALFKDPDAVANSLDKLRAEGISDHDMVVISGVPYPAQVLGRPMVWEKLPWISLTGAAIGFMTGIFLNAGTPLLYPIHVGGQALIPIPPTAVLTYELTMMGLIISTFLGVLWESAFPSFGPKYYDPALTHGRIGILFQCPTQNEDELQEMLKAQGAERVYHPERRPL